MDEGESIYIFVASSGDKESLRGRNIQGKTLPLTGIKFDKKMFKQKFRMENAEFILSNRECN